MKFIVIGGSGGMGSAAAYDLMKSDGVEEVLIVSRKAKKAHLPEKLAASEKVGVKNLDINDYDAMIKEMKNYDAVVNCVGPFYSTGYKVASIAIDAGIDYVDIADDYDAVEKMQDESLDKKAKAAGITVLYGMGADPGTANVLARYAADKMDSVEEVEFFWVLGASDCEGKAVWEHILHMNTGLVPQYIDGKIQQIPAGSGSEVVEFIDPFGSCNVHYVGHPEPLTVFHHIPGVKRVVNKGGILPTWVNEAIKVQNQWGFSSNEPIAVGDTQITPRELAMELWSQRPPEGDFGDYKSGVKVVVKGTVKEEPTTYTYDLGGNTAPGTGIPASIGAQMIARGDVKTKGVVAPEGCIDPETYLNEFVKRRAVIFENKRPTDVIRKEKK